MASTKVGISDMKIISGQGELVTYALGSCIGIAFYDPLTKIGALLHIMLPEHQEVRDGNILKYADTGIVHTINMLAQKGAIKRRLICKIAGGASMFQSNVKSNIGQRNIIATKKILMSNGLKVFKEDVGGSIARTMQMDVSTGNVQVKCYGRETIVL